MSFMNDNRPSNLFLLTSPLRPKVAALGDCLVQRFANFFGQATLFNSVNIYGTRTFCGLSFIK
jgi:hypothetical protein